MLKNKLVLFVLLLLLPGTCVFAAETLSDMRLPKPPAYRVGISELPEKQYIKLQQEKENLAQIKKMKEEKEKNIADLTYADLSIKNLSKEIAKELEYEEQDMVADLSLLWQGAATHSDTINFALYKLANPDADKPDTKSIKNVLTTIAGMSTLVGASIANPLLAGSSLIGGNILSIMSQDTKALNYKYTKVSDADMIILIRKVEDLQQNAINLYYDYMTSKIQLEKINKLVDERKRKFELAQKNNAQRELIVVTDAYYRTAIDRQRTAKSEFFSRRAALEQFVGNEAFVQFEAELTARENGEKSPSTLDAQQKKEYDKTVQDVETFTSNTSENSAQQIPAQQELQSDLQPDLQNNSEKPVSVLSEQGDNSVKNQVGQDLNVKTINANKSENSNKTDKVNRTNKISEEKQVSKTNSSVKKPAVSTMPLKQKIIDLKNLPAAKKNNSVSAKKTSSNKKIKSEPVTADKNNLPKKIDNSNHGQKFLPLSEIEAPSVNYRENSIHSNVYEY